MRRVFLVGIIFAIYFLGGIRATEGGEFFEVSMDEVLWEVGQAGKPYVVLLDMTFAVRDLDGNITSRLENFDSGTARLNTNGELETFEGTAGKFGSNSIVNGNKYRIPATMKFKYEFGTTTLTPGEDCGDFIYQNKNAGGGLDPVTHIDSGCTEFSIREFGGKTVISSEHPLEISNIETGNIRVEPIGGGDATIGLDADGKLSSFENAKVTFEEQGISASNSLGTKTDVYYGKNCVEHNSYFCINTDLGDENLLFGSTDGRISPDVEMRGRNIFFNGAEDDYVKFSSITPKSALKGVEPTKVLIQKDMATVMSGNVEVVNGGNNFMIDSSGEIFSSRAVYPEGTSMPMKIYTSEGGKLADYVIDVGEAGVTDISKVGLRGQGEYLVKRTMGGGAYGMPDAAVVEEVSEGVVESVVSESGLFSGNLGSDKVRGYTIYTPGNSGRMSTTYRELGSIKQANVFGIGNDYIGGVDCSYGADTTKAVMDMYSKSDRTDMPFYVEFVKEDGTKGFFGDESLRPVR